LQILGIKPFGEPVENLNQRGVCCKNLIPGESSESLLSQVRYGQEERVKEIFMSLQFSHDDPPTPESAVRARQLLEDQQWYADHAQELHQRFAGLFVAVAGREPFAAATREGAYALAKQHKPDRDPIVFFLPRERKLSVSDLPRSV